MTVSSAGMNIIATHWICFDQSSNWGSFLFRILLNAPWLLFNAVISCSRWRTNGELWVCFADKYLAQSSISLVATEHSLDHIQEARTLCLLSLQLMVVPDMATKLQWLHLFLCSWHVLPIWFSLFFQYVVISWLLLFVLFDCYCYF